MSWEENQKQKILSCYKDDTLEKGRKAMIGEVRTFKDGDHKKQADGSWLKVEDIKSHNRYYDNISVSVKKIKDLISEVRSELKIKQDASAGDCAIACYRLLEKDPELKKNYKLYSTYVGEDEHVVLKNTKSNTIIDPTVDQFTTSHEDGAFIGPKEDSPVKYKSWYKHNESDIEAIKKEYHSTLEKRQSK